MEDHDQSEQQQQISNDDAVGFPTPAPRKKKSSPLKWILIMVVIVVLAGGAAYFLLNNSNQSIEPEDSSLGSGMVDESTPRPTPVATETPAPIDRESVSIQILNGTGITGEANYLEEQIKKLGYTKTDKGNNSSQDETATTVTFASSVSQGIKDEITDKLKELYNDVKTSSSSLGAGIDIRIVTGLKKGTTPKPSNTPAATTKATATPTVAASPTATP